MPKAGETLTEEQKAERRAKMETNRMNLLAGEGTPAIADASLDAAKVTESNADRPPVTLDQLIGSLTTAQKAVIAQQYAQEIGKPVKPMQAVYIQSPEDHYDCIIEPGWHYCNVERHPEQWNLPDAIEAKIREGYTVVAMPSKNLAVMRIPSDKFEATERAARERWAKMAGQETGNFEDEERWQSAKASSKSLEVGMRVAS